MRASVQAGFVPFSTPLEGFLNYMYLDAGDTTDPTVTGKVTIGMGDLIDDGTESGWGPALAVPKVTSASYPNGASWVHSTAYPSGASGPVASDDDVIEAWKAVHNRQDLKGLGGGNAAFPALTSVRLTDDAVAALIQSKLAANEDTLRGYFPSYDSWPADGQLGLLSMAWGLGPHFADPSRDGTSDGWPKFRAALNGVSSTNTQGPPDFAAAAAESHQYNATAARNAANYKLFMNAHTVAEQNLDPEVLYYPGEPSVADTIRNAGYVMSEAVSSVMSGINPDLPIPPVVAAGTTASAAGIALSVVVVGVIAWLLTRNE